MGEPAVGLFFQHHWRYRTKVFAVLDLVDPGLHGSAKRRCQDRACTESARPQFHPPLEPADDLVLYEEIGRLVRNMVETPVGQLRPAQELLDLTVAVGRAQENMLHEIRPFLAVPLLEIDPERCTEGRAGIARRRLHPDPLERPAVA